ncbi:hypothetical protein H311_04373 [Anncaliia algerae PRA109]|nr:hypothetical protein H311_04373 [Anncaliia algerae PRA109]
MISPDKILKTFLEEKITIRCKDVENIIGILQGFDEHFNVALQVEDKIHFIRGENIIHIALNKTN